MFSVISPYSHSQVDREAVVNAVQHFLKSCQPFFNKLEAVARDTAFRPNPLPLNVYTMVLYLRNKSNLHFAPDSSSIPPHQLKKAIAWCVRVLNRLFDSNVLKVCFLRL